MGLTYLRKSNDTTPHSKEGTVTECGKCFKNCLARIYHSQRHGDEAGEAYWENQRNLENFPCLRRGNQSSHMANWANRYWKKLSKVYISLCEASNEKSNDNPPNLIDEFVIAINNILRGIGNHLASMHSQKRDAAGMTGCPYVDAVFFPNLHPVYYCRFGAWDNDLSDFVRICRDRVLLLATYLKVISHRAAKFPVYSVWLPPKHRKKNNIERPFRPPNSPFDIAITAFQSREDNLPMDFKKQLLSPLDLRTTKESGRIVEVPVPQFTDNAPFRCEWFRIHFPPWPDFMAEEFDFTLHLATPEDLKATAKLKNAYAAVSSALLLPCCKSPKHQKNNANIEKHFRSMPPQVTIHAPIVLPNKGNAHALDVRSSIQEVLLKILARVKPSRKPLSPSPMPVPHGYLSNMLEVVLNLHDWKQRNFCLHLDEYIAKTREYFLLMDPAVEGPRLPAFFRKQWYICPKRENRHEKNALRLLILLLARIDFSIKAREINESILRREMLSICQQVRNLGFRPSSRRSAKVRNKTCRKRQMKFDSLEKWLEDYINRHARKYWDADLIKVLKGELEDEFVLCGKDHDIKARWQIGCLWLIQQQK